MTAYIAMYRRIQIILKMFIHVHVLTLSKENGEHSLVLCLSKDEKTFLNGTLNIKYEKKIIQIVTLHVCALLPIPRGPLDL